MKRDFQEDIHFIGMQLVIVACQSLANIFKMSQTIFDVLKFTHFFAFFVDSKRPKSLFAKFFCLLFFHPQIIPADKQNIHSIQVKFILLELIWFEGIIKNIVQVNLMAFGLIS